jgi:hypothetical protein
MGWEWRSSAAAGLRAATGAAGARRAAWRSPELGRAGACTRLERAAARLASRRRTATRSDRAAAPCRGASRAHLGIASR